MTQRENDEQRKLTRRAFIQYSAVASGTVAGVHAMMLKTDAMAQQNAIAPDNDGNVTYSYQ